MNVLLYILCLLLISIIIIVFKFITLKNIKYKKPEILSNKKILIVYYSHCGNTRCVAENINSLVGGDIKEIQLVENYPNNIFKMSNLIRKHMKEGYLPAIKEFDVSNYDVIFTGFPIWNFSISLPMKSFLKHNNFENKTLMPFFTCSGGVSKKKVMNEIKNFTNIKMVKPPLFMFENGIFLIKEQIVKWLNNL